MTTLDEAMTTLRKVDRQLHVVLTSPVLREHNAIVLREIQADIRTALGLCRHGDTLGECGRCALFDQAVDP